MENWERKKSPLICTTELRHIFLPACFFMSQRHIITALKKHLEGIMNHRCSMWVAFLRAKLSSSFCHPRLPIKVCLNYGMFNPVFKLQKDQHSYFKKTKPSNQKHSVCATNAKDGSRKILIISMNIQCVFLQLGLLVDWAFGIYCLRVISLT